MQSLSRLKYSLNFNKSLDEIINILKMSTAIQLRQFQSKSWGKEIFLKELQQSFSLVKKKNIVNHPLISREEKTPKGIVVITSDESFSGELNTRLIDEALKAKQNKEDLFVTLGTKGAQILRGMKKSYLSFPGIGEKTYFEDAYRLKQFLMSEYLKGTMNRIVIIYAEFITITTQRVKRQKLLPFALEEIEQFLRTSDGYEELLIEPSYDSVVEMLIGFGLEVALNKIFYSSASR